MRWVVVILANLDDAAYPYNSRTRALLSFFPRRWCHSRAVDLTQLYVSGDEEFFREKYRAEAKELTGVSFGPCLLYVVAEIYINRGAEFLGYQTSPLGFNGHVAAELGFGQGEDPVVVVAVDPEGPAAAKGIQTHDVITEVDQERVTSLQQFMHFVSGLEEGRSALFWFWRPENGIDVRAFKIPE